MLRTVRLAAACLLAGAASGLVPAAWAQSLKSDQVLSSIGVSVLAPPNPVLGADGRVHCVFRHAGARRHRRYRGQSLRPRP